MEALSVGATLKQLSTANMKSKLENLMAANDGGNDESGAYHRSVRYH